MDVDVTLEWSDEPSVVVDRGNPVISVRAHPGLSEAQVRQACQELGAEGPLVLAAWQRVVGIKGVQAIDYPLGQVN
jgi:hypothetical protein